MNPLERFSRACIVPVVVLDNVEDAVPTAKALLAGGIDVMEITFRTAAAKDSIAAVAAGYAGGSWHSHKSRAVQSCCICRCRLYCFSRL